MSFSTTEVPPPSRGPFDPHDGTWAFPKRDSTSSGRPKPQYQTNNVPEYARQQQEQQIQM